MTYTPNAVQTWETGEVDLWISNEQYLYDEIAGQGLSAGEIREIIRDFRRTTPELKVDMTLVSWSYLRDTYKEAE